MDKKKKKSKKVKPRWVLPAGVQPTAMDLKIMEAEAAGKLVPRPKLIKTTEQIEGIRKAGVLNTAVLDHVAEHIKAGMSTNEIDKMVIEQFCLRNTTKTLRQIENWQLMFQR